MDKVKTNKTEKNSKPVPYAVGSREGQIFVSVPYTLEDFKNSLLIVSVLVNLVFLILWIMTQVDAYYAYQVSQILLSS